MPQVPFTERRAKLDEQRREDRLVEALIESEDYKILLSKDFKSAGRSAKRELRALQKRVENQDITVLSYLKAYETVLDKALKFRADDAQTASLIIAGLRQIDSIVTQVVLASGVDREIKQVWARLSLGPWLTTSQLIRNQLVVSAAYRPNVLIESVKIRLPKKQRNPVLPLVRVALSVDDASTRRVEVYSQGVLLRKRQVALKKNKLIKLSFRSPLGTVCFLFVDKFMESAYMCIDLSRILQYFPQGSNILTVQRAGLLPSGEFVKDLNRIFVVKSIDNKYSTGLLMF